MGAARLLRYRLDELEVSSLRERDTKDHRRFPFRLGNQIRAKPVATGAIPGRVAEVHETVSEKHDNAPRGRSPVLSQLVQRALDRSWNVCPLATIVHLFKRMLSLFGEPRFRDRREAEC